MPTKVHVGPYEFVEQIAQSDIAVSYGVHVPTRSGAVRLAALKVLNPKVSGSPEFQEALAEQARLAEQLNHPSLAQTFDCGVREGAAYLLLEYVSGAPLSALLKNQPIDASVAAHIVSELAIGVAHAHGRRDKSGQSLDIVHGDIRPRNVLISSAGAVKLVDFGLARARKLCGADPVPEALRDADMFAYADPDHAAGEEPSIASDVFSLSALLWSMLAGRPLFDGADYASTLRLAQAGEIENILSVRPDLEPTLASLVMRGLRQGGESERDLNTAQSLRTGLSQWLRENDPSFGRHRVSEAFGDELQSTKSLQRSRPLSRREFTPEDTCSLIFPAEDGVRDQGMSVDFDELFKGNVLATASVAPPLAESARSTMALNPLSTGDFIDEDEENEVELLELDDEVEILDDASAVAAPPAAPAPASAGGSRLAAALAAARDERPTGVTGSKRGSLPPIAPPAAATAPPTSSGLATEGTALLSPQTVEETLETEAAPKSAAAERPAGATGSKRRSLPPAAPPAPAEARVADTKDTKPSTDDTQPSAAEKKKGSISLDAATRSSDDENIFASMSSKRPSTQLISPSEHVEDVPASPSGIRGLPQDDYGDLQTEVTAPNAVLSRYNSDVSPSLRVGSDSFDKLADEEFADATSSVARRPSARGIEPTPSQARKREPVAIDTESFDPNAIYEESSNFYDDTPRGSHYDAYDSPPPKKRSPLVPLLILMVLGMAGYIAYNTLGGGEGTVAEATVAGLHVRSTPDRARIFIDDVDTGHTTPHTFADMKVGSSVRVRAMLPGYQDSPSVTAQVSAGALQEVQLELQPLQHSIRVKSTPPGATVYVDGDERGVTPTIVGPLETNPTHGVNISLQLEGYKPQASQHTWKAGESASELSLELEEIAPAGRRRR